MMFVASKASHYPTCPVTILTKLRKRPWQRASMVPPLNWHNSENSLWIAAQTLIWRTRSRMSHRCDRASPADVAVASFQMIAKTTEEALTLPFDCESPPQWTG